MNQLATTTPRQSALAVMASKFSVEPNKLLDTLKATVFKNASNEELLALVVVSNQYGLNPLTKEIYAFPAKGGGIVPVVSVDGWMRMMNDHPQFDGIDFEDRHDGDKLICITAIIHRKDRSRPTRVTEYLSECIRNTEPWKMQHRMLRHKALSQCVRVAFGFSGLHDEDEAKDINDRVKVIELPKIETVAPVETSETPEKRHRRTKAEMEAARAAETPAQPDKTQEQPAATEAAASTQPTDRDKLKMLVEESGFTEDQAMHTLRKMRFALPAATTYADIKDQVVADILADTKTLIDGIAATFA